jgi:hypothetical protein
MRMSTRRSMTIVTLCLALTAFGGAAAGQGAARAAAPYCGITWGSADKSGGALSSAPLVAVRSTSGTCSDRIEFEFNGTAKGYSVGYAAQVPTEGQGLDLAPYTAGGAYLYVTLRAPAYDANGASTINARDGAHLVNALGYDTLRDGVFGGSFEGYTTVAVGVRARLPFRVTLLTGPGTHSRIAVDVADLW